jgi:flagellar biosynthesis/type III secretory pathway M-ring protein FliF/YscJ
VAGITGLDEQRGDKLVIETLPFESTLSLEAPEPAAPGAPKPTAPQGFKLHWDKKTIIIGAATAGGVLVLAVVFGLLRRRRGGRAPVAVSVPAELPAGDKGASVPAVHAGAGIEQELESRLAERDALQQKLNAQALNSLKLAPVITKTAEVLAKHLRDKIKQEPEVSAQVLRTWIREEEN